MISGYRVEAVLGRGAMGVVHRATDVRLGRKVALKVLSPEFGDDERFRARFLRESRAAAAIDHPGVIPVYEAGDVGGQLYIAMRDVDGIDLERLLEAEGPVAPERALALVAQLAAALDAAHQRGLVHRDVKPSNVLVAKGDHVYLSDFSLTKAAADDLKLTASGEVVAGTALYMAPETLRTGRADARSDLNSLGCVLFECLAGEPPFTGPTQVAVIFGHLEESPPRVSERRAGLPHALDSVLARALDKDSEHRYASGAELVAAAHEALAGRAPAPSRRRRMVAGAAALAVAAGAAALLVDSDGTPSVATIQGDAVAAIDPDHGSLTGEVTLDGAPDAMVAGAGAVWVTDRDRNVVSGVDIDTRTIRQTIPVGNAPSAIAVEPHGVWVANSQDGTVSVISPRTNQVAERIDVGRQVDGLCAAGGAVWVASPLEYAVMRLDPRTGRRTAKVILDSQPAKLASGDGVVWASHPSYGTVTEISASTATATRPIQLSRGVSALAVGHGVVWVANPLEGTVSRVDRKRGVVTATVPVGRNDGPVSVAVTPSAVWVANEFAGTLARIDPKRAEVAEKLDVGNRPLALTVVDGALWLGVADAGARRRGGTVSIEWSDSERWRDMDFAVGPRPAAGDLTNDGLTGYIRKGGTPTLAANLAETLPVPSDGGRTYAFRLRRGIRYSTGEPVRPSDVRFVLERGISQRGFADQFVSAIRGSRACRPGACDLSRGIVADDKAGTVVFHLTEPDGDLLYKLAMPFAVLLPPSVGMKVPAGRPLPATGPYRIARFDKGREVRLERNPQFKSWSPAVRPDGNPDAVVVRYRVPARGAAERVSSGKADIFPNAVERLTTQVAQIRRRTPELMRDSPAPVTTWFLLNTRVAPFDNLGARRAVAFAFDRRGAARALGGGTLARPTCQLLPPGFAGFRPYCPFTASGTASGRPDLATARRLVKRSGTRGAHVVVHSFDILNRSVPEVMVRTLRRLGYDASLRVLPVSRHFTTLFDTSKRVQIGVHPWIADFRPRRPSSTYSRARPSAGAIPSTSTRRSSATARPTG